MKQLIIIGAGGMGRTMYSNALECVGYGTEFIVKGFLNDFPSLDQFENYPPIIGTIENYQPQDEDVFVCSIGDKQRKQCIEKIQGRGGEFINLIHQTARFYTNAKLGKGNFIGAYTVIGNDAQIGDFNSIDTHVTCVGGIIIEDHVNIHTSAVISHNVVVESEANVGACSFVIRRVKSGTTVFGNPAKKLV